ncbi:hypothetical protein Fmac_007654 [Flemingia macrophylla]|uniref:Secreted protein n=1 Tax=Flemingia macrophylla TaxID=520843 RepID=A0ABD1MV93_9FABA
MFLLQLLFFFLHKNFSIPMFVNASDCKKKKDIEAVHDPTTTKKCCGSSPSRNNRVPNTTLM